LCGHCDIERNLVSQPETDLDRAMRTTHRAVDGLRLATRSEELLALTAAIEQLAFVAGKLIEEMHELKRQAAELRGEPAFCIERNTN
jgi:hypothetical protein